MQKQLPSFVLPALTASLALVVGALAGGMGAWFVRPQVEAEIVERTRIRAPTSEELDALCAPAILTAANQLEDAQQKVANLELEISAKAAEVEALAKQMADRTEKGKAFVAQLNTARDELARLRGELEVAQQEKEALVEELRATVAELAETKEVLDATMIQLDETKEQSLGNQWEWFLRDAELEICERGGRKKMVDCRRLVTDAVSSRKEAFMHCIRSEQATPALYEVDKREAKKGFELPEFAEWLDEDERVVKGWYILMCDPTLPEAGGDTDAEEASTVEEVLRDFDELDLDE